MASDRDSPLGDATPAAEPAPADPSSTPAGQHRGMELRRLGGATIFMMAAVLASRVIGYLREAYIAYAFGAGAHTDAFVTAFTIPDWLNYLVAGGALSITFITIFSPYLAQNRENEGYRVFSIVATFITAVLAVGILIAEIFAPQLLHLYVPEFKPAVLRECVAMTRILLPAQIFFVVGGLAAATLYARGSFFLPAMAGLVYNVGIIAGGVLFGRWLGIKSLAVGALLGAIGGPFLMPFAGALRHGLRYRPMFALRDAVFRRWIKLTLPLMIGVTLVMADDWIMRPLAAGFVGSISHLNYAKRLMGVPIAVLGLAVGQASMPFFTWLIAQNRWDEFRTTLDRTVLRTVTGALLASSWFAALSLPLVRLVYEHGRFHEPDARATAFYLFIFVLSLAFWSSQGLFARAFYAAGNTFTPMLAGTLLTVCLIPLYIVFAHRLQVIGLAIASDTAIVAHTVMLAVLLKRRNWLGFSATRWKSMPRVLATALVAGWAVHLVVGRLEAGGYHWTREIAVIVAASLVWAAVVYALSRLLRLKDLLDDTGRLVRRVGSRFGILAPRGDGGP